jgi:hypothetical protein
MLALMYAYLCVPRRFRFLARWLAVCLFLVVLILVLILFSQVLLTLPGRSWSWFHPQPHRPMSPDFISRHLRQSVTLRRIRED